MIRIGGKDMATTKEYKNYVLEKLECLDSIFCRPMMGGYLFYYNSILFGGIYEEDCFLIKKTINNSKYNLQERIPYKGAKAMYWLEDLEDIELLENIILDTCEDLKVKSKTAKD